MARLFVNVYRTIRDNWFRFLSIALVISVALISFNGMILAFINLTTTYHTAFEENNMASFTVQTANPGGSGSDAYFNYTKGIEYIEQYKQTGKYGNYIESYELRIVYDLNFNISGNPLSGRIVAFNTTDSQGYREQPTVNGYKLLSGAGFNEISQYRNVCLVEGHLGDYWDIEESSFMKVGDTTFQVQGTIASPEYLLNMGSYADLFPSPRRFGVIFMPLQTAQRLLNVPGRVNEISVKLKNGLNLETSFRQKIADNFVTFLETDPQDLKLGEPVDLDYQVSYWLLRMDIEEAREMGIVLPLVLLVMAISGLYVLLGRIVASERKEIGVSQALGYSRRYIITHYVLLAVSISIVGTIIGTVVGVIGSEEFSKLYVRMLGMKFPAYTTTNWFIVIIGVILGIATGLIGGYFPVRNSIQPVPAESLRYDPSLHITSGNIPLVERLLQKIKIKPNVTGLRLPIRNFFRSKRRTLSSLLGVIIAVSIISLGFGMIDSMDHALDQQYEVYEDWDLNVSFNEAVTNASSFSKELNRLEGVTSTYSFASGTTVTTNSSSVEENLQLIGLYDYNDTGYLGHKFEFKAGEFNKSEVVLTLPIANNLGVWVGDTVNLEIAKLTALESLTPFRASFELVNVSFRVSGIVDEFNGLVAYIGLKKLINVSNMPGAGTDAIPSIATSLQIKHENPSTENLQDLKEYIYDNMNYKIRVASTKSEQIRDLQNLLDLIYVLMYIIAVFAVLLAAAMIYNTVYINLEERKREIATLLTMGTPGWSLIKSVTVENILIFALGSIFGLMLGWAMLWFFLIYILDMEFFRLSIRLSQQTIIISELATLIGLLVAQYFPLRKTLNMNLAEATKERVV